MTPPNVRGLIFVGSMVLLWAAPVRAQQVATSFGELRGLIKPGETIYVTDTRGATTKGKLVGLSVSSLEVRVDDGSAPSLRLSERDVNNVVAKRSDSWWNGPLIGLATGAGSGLFIELAGRTEYQKFSGGAAVGLGVIGLTTGLLIDALNGEKVTVYVHPAQPRASIVRVLPLLSDSRAGVQISIGF